MICWCARHRRAPPWSGPVFEADPCNPVTGIGVGYSEPHRGLLSDRLPSSRQLAKSLTHPVG
ncbi:MAG: hypothetical protein EA400_13420 [Chromatiaceae bacterium]|nr:MAG: hypothetical protein EA400_13420 [Chromatiaceae bacterium]